MAFVGGFAALGYEVLWGRLARFLIGERTIATASLLFIFIACLGLGAWIAPVLGKKLKTNTPTRTRTVIAVLFLVTAAFHLTCVSACYRNIRNEGVVFSETLENELPARIQNLWLLMAPPVLVLGIVFPLLAWSAGETESHPGRTVGDLYMINTIGASAGAVVATFAFSPKWNTAGGFLAVTGMLTVVAAAVLILQRGNRPLKVLAVAALVVFGFAYLWFPRSLVVLRNDEQLLESNEDEYGVQVLVTTTDGNLRLRNNRRQLVRDLGDPATSQAQQMAAHLAILLADQCRDVLNIGTGYGITAGTITLYEDVQVVETIELLPFVADRQARFADYNFNYLQDPRVTLIRGDGYHKLMTTSSTYDVISVNVLDPHLPGSSALYTVDFWRTARRRLNRGGVLTQLIWGDDAVPVLVRGLQSVFPTVRYYPAYGGSAYNAIAFRDLVADADMRLHLDRVGHRSEDALTKLLGTQWSEKLRGVLLQTSYETEYLDRRAAKNVGRLHTRNFPVLEYRGPPRRK